LQAGKPGGAAMTTTFTVAQVLSAASQGINLGTAAILDSSATVMTNLDVLETLSVAGKIGPINFTDATPPTLSIPAYQDIADSAVIGLFQGVYGLAIQNATVANALEIAKQAHIASVTISDYGTNIQSALDKLEAISSSINVASIAISPPYWATTQVVTLTQAQALNDLPVISKLQAFANVDAQGISIITVAGNVTMAQAVAIEDANPYIGKLNVLDSYADIATVAMNAHARLNVGPVLFQIYYNGFHNYDFASITLTDTPTPTFNYSYKDYSNLYGNPLSSPLLVIGSPYNLILTDAPISGAVSDSHVKESILDTAANVQAHIDTLESLVLAKNVTGITISDTSNPIIAFTPAEQIVDAAAIAMIKGTSADHPTVTAPPNPGHGIVIEQGDSFQFAIAPSGDGMTFTVTNNSNGVASVYDIHSVSYLKFSDTTTVVANADDANLARLYSAALGRGPDQGGLESWEAIYHNNISAAVKAEGVYVSLGQASGNFNGSLPIAYGFIDSPEFQQKYGSLNNTQFVIQLYENVLGRGPDQAGLDGWISAMDHGYTQGMVLVGFAESPENIAKDAHWLIQV
jgi:hypothetical protein